MTQENDALSRLANVVPETTLQRIEEKLSHVRHKRALSRLIAANEKFGGVKAGSVYNNWIYGLAIPEKHQDEVLQFITNYILKVESK